MFRREFLFSAGKQISGIDVIPVVEVWAAVGTIPAIHSCLAGARPVGFAIITSNSGYWLVRPEDLSDLAHAIDACIISQDWAS